MTKHTRSKHKEKRKTSKGSVFKKIFLGLLSLFLIVGIAASIFVFTIIKSGPKLDINKLEDSRSSEIFASNGDLIYELGEKKRETVEVEDTPQALKDAITSIEDKRFNEHFGVDPIRIAGAAISNLKSNSRQGGSTLTQQLIKLSFFSTSTKDQNYKRKIQEAWLSVQLERQLSKDEILTLYVNKVFMANGFYGMQTAAKGYYNKTLDELSLAQTALLAGLPQAPIDYDPVNQPEQAKTRRDLVLSEMLKDEKINQKQYDDAISEPIDYQLIKEIKDPKQNRVIDNYVKQVIQEVEETTDYNIYTDGLDIYTNIDMSAQKYLYNLVNSDEEIYFPSDDFQTAVTITNPNNGQVIAQLGGRKIPDDTQLGNNLAVTAERDFGSTVKPITDYAPAIEKLGYGTGKIMSDSPYTYPGTDIEVNNYDKQFKGNITMREALVDSRNVPAIRTLDEVGLDYSQKFLGDIGIKYKDGLFLSNAITGSPSSEQMAGAYGTFANGGTYYKPTYINKIVLPDGREDNKKPKGTRAMRESTAYLITDMLKDVIKRGTGTNASISWLNHAGKTGTSNYPDDYLDKVEGDVYQGAPDISFVGYSRNFVISVWTGYKEYKHAISKSDQQIASDIYRIMMSHLSSDIETPDWEMPDNVASSGNELYITDHVYEEDDNDTSYFETEKNSKKKAINENESFDNDVNVWTTTEQKSADVTVEKEPETEATTKNDKDNETETKAPQTEAPQTEAPQTEAPQTDPPQTNPPQTDPPQTDPPQTDPPQTDPPQTDPPKTDSPKN